MYPALPGFEGIKRYWDKTRNCYMAKILPGEYYVTLKDEKITTVLGSCVSACIRDSRFGIGGMNHFMLPDSAREDDHWRNGPSSNATRYGSYAMEQLINEILKNGGRREFLEVKLVGGGRILRRATDVGRRNIEFVLDYIATEGLTLVGTDLGDVYPRKVVYSPASGKVQVKKLRTMHNETIVERESHYMEDLQHTPSGGDVELF
ncbi:chemoreceptor glutamine deamidase CheD [Thiohalobacter sp. IOR34]|uniref:chemoreceptor glutamine deamidase CheD n=1 Tax=Thiohalobacter sp. IOR34 TaxID=3057176 RepID=UPI0025B1D74A|nr:chemoreceptor glutamine deamidase CheD [Thiohalobacter sp. IOR34]WJW76426.1 chemoreceptor glutamine deamidase CheD [Thiohalobacter sp. IOR34]